VENLKDKSHFGETGIGVKYLKKQDVKKVEWIYLTQDCTVMESWDNSIQFSVP
jgi:hypothetical protein